MRTSNQGLDPSLFSPADLQTLLTPHTAPCVSIYLPSEAKGADILAVILALGQLIEQAEAALVAYGLRPAEAQAILAPGRALLTHPRDAFWQTPDQGLAFFLATDIALYYHLPQSFSQLMTVGEQFYLRPLVPLLSGDGRFHVLALSEKSVRLFACTRFACQEVDLPAAPHSLDDLMRYVELEKQVQQHSTASSGRGGGQRAAVFHGQGGAGDAAVIKTYRQQFLRDVDAAVMARLQNTNTPLVLAGVKSIQSAYREVSRYPNISLTGISGSPDRQPMQTLHDQAWEAVAPAFQAERLRMVHEFARLYNQTDPRAVSELSQVLAAAYGGQIVALFITGETPYWGSFDPATNQMDLHDEAQLGDEDLVDFAVRHTLRNKGLVYRLDVAEMPADQPAAALLRY